MSAFDLVTITLIRKVGSVKRPTGGYDDVLKETRVSGCRIYRRRPGYQRLEDRPKADGANPGITTLVSQLICSMPLTTDVKIGDVLRMADGRRFLVQDPRPYDRCIQCDLEDGANQQDSITDGSPS